jgi:hypothetical protein
VILNEAIRHVISHSYAERRRIEALHLGYYFTVIELDDGSVGACMCYHRFPPRVLGTVEQMLSRSIAEDPLLLEALFGRNHMRSWLGILQGQEHLLVSNLQATVISALTVPLLRCGGDDTFRVQDSLPWDPFAQTTRALVIGFGGLMDSVIRSDTTEEIHVADLAYPSCRQEMDAILNEYRRKYPWKRITISDGSDTVGRLGTADAAAITGSALCNGTMDNLLNQAGGRCRLVVQGQSAGIHPEALFQRGVEVVITTIKPRTLVKLAGNDPYGSSLRPVLEGALPWVYLVPRDGA